MVNAHYRCPACGHLYLLAYIPADVDGPDWPPTCYTCDDAQLERAPQPGDFGFDVKTDGDGGKGFQKFTVHRQVPTKEGLVQVEESIDSLHKMRQIEKDSEQRYRDGEGEPLRFRGYAQNGSNMDVGSFGTEGTIGGRHYDSGHAPTKKMPVTRHGTKKPTVKVARGGGRSPL